MIDKLKQKIGLEILENVSLKNHTTFKIGGPAKFFVEVKSKAELFKALTACNELKLEHFILGGGSNVLVADAGFDGLVIKASNGTPEFKNNLVTVFSGTNLGFMIREGVAKGLGGLEFAGNIPGTIGGGVRGNCGAYGQGVGDFVKQVEVIVLGEEEVSLKIMTKPECEFAYRESIFKREPSWIIAEVQFELPSDDQADQKLAQIDAEWKERACKQPLTAPSAGCSFKNVLYNDSLSKYEDWAIKGKLPAAKFIEEADLKGMKIGGAMVSDKHANFILNFDNAKADHVAQLISLVKTRVRDQFGVNLEEEVQYIGF
jgi:UDP-N-acetylmuramate dehydrogenase